MINKVTIVLVFLFLSNLTIGQVIPLRLKIDAINYNDSINKRTFIINYNIENLTNKELTYFLNPTDFISNTRASLSTKIAYKIYQDNDLINVDDIINDENNTKLKGAKSDKELSLLMNKFLITNGIYFDNNNPIDSLTLSKLKAEKLFSSMQTIGPNETKSYTKKLFWDKTRYYKLDDNEFYLDEKSNHFLEISITLLKEEYQKTVSKEMFETITKNKNFIKGSFVSNRHLINFQ